MIEALKEAVLEKSGIQMQGRGDCHFLSDLILGQTNEFISYNTLRRMYGFAPEVKPRTKTLDVLAQFCGYPNFQRFCLQHSLFERWHRQLNGVHRIHQKSPDQSLECVLEVAGSLERIELAGQIACAYVDAEQWDQFAEFCQSVKPLILEQDYMAQLYFGNRVGLRLENIRGPIPKALMHSSVISLVCTIHINYLSVDGFQGRWWERLNRTTQVPEISHLIKCLLQTRRLLLNKPLKKHLGSQLLENDTTKLHPILRSRILATLWMEGRRDFKRLWSEVHGQPTSTGVQLSWLHEISMLALMTGDFTLSKHVAELKLLSGDIPFYQLHHLHLLFLVRALAKVAEGDLPGARIALNSIDTSNIRIGYRGIVELIRLRLETALDTTNETLKAELESKIEEVNLPYFSGSWNADYLLND